MSATIRSKRLMLRAVLRGVSPMVVRLLSVSDDTELPDLHDAFQQVLGWSGRLGYAFRIQGQEFNSFRRRSRARPLRAFRLHRQENLLYLYDFLDLWESGTSAYSTFSKGLNMTWCRSASVAAALHHPSSAAAQPAVG